MCANKNRIKDQLILNCPLGYQIYFVQGCDRVFFFQFQKRNNEIEYNGPNATWTCFDLV